MRVWHNRSLEHDLADVIFILCLRAVSFVKKLTTSIGLSVAVFQAL
ncbi:hypothetical protein PPEP_a0914 [Pseudoalteromonas peptidolytica F12-50-A1]|uniref:Uncharacterized protein n=1 Tax=Pseudoalteromonas peptidolytica F12-50-A1 TaxID=1315280 RepID=A0A8I0MVI0_9GAMM|nr:hypothetical protein [Pseudoalteromonas peptidolytica F12-50-A1]